MAVPEVNDVVRRRKAVQIVMDALHQCGIPAEHAAAVLSCLGVTEEDVVACNQYRLLNQDETRRT